MRRFKKHQQEIEGMILREWRAEFKRELRDEYIFFVRRTSLAHYTSISGNLGASLAVKNIDGARCEMVLISFWESETAIEAFAGSPIDRASYYPEDDRYLLTRPEKVSHYDLAGLQTLTIRR